MSDNRYYVKYCQMPIMLRLVLSSNLIGLRFLAIFNGSLRQLTSNRRFGQAGGCSRRSKSSRKRCRACQSFRRRLKGLGLGLKHFLAVALDQDAHDFAHAPARGADHLQVRLGVARSNAMQPSRRTPILFG